MSYYRNNYRIAQRQGIQGWGNSLIDQEVERLSIWKPGAHALEIGASSGEHFEFVRHAITIKSYTALDLEPRITNPKLANQLEQKGLVSFVSGDAHELPFRDSSFDLSISTCVLAHVKEPESVFCELRRVTKSLGCIVVGMPCDPGVLNRVVKQLVTYRSMKRSGVADPKLSYAREHRNPIGNLTVLARHTFRNDHLRLKYYPIGIASWNVNLAVTLQVIVNK